MAWIEKILDKLNGLHFRQEYLCVAKETFQQGLCVYLVQDNRVVLEITNDHLFVGYHPLVFVLYPTMSFPTLTPFTEKIKLIFTQRQFVTGQVYEKPDAVAILGLELIKKDQVNGQLLFFYRGLHGSHHFISRFNQLIIDIKNKLYNRKPGNIFLKGNLYKQVQIAYALPRIISTITVGDGNHFNLFPTDLHGPVNDELYIGSLRHGGMACKQIEEVGSLLISQIDLQDYQRAYSLGKNHMQDLKPRENFPFAESASETLQLPYLPSTLFTGNCR